jgi:hypothetical protein
MELSVRKFLVSKQITVLEHPPYSLDLAPSDFFLFPKMEEILNGRHFDDIDDIRSNMMADLNVIPQNLFQNCFEGRTRRCHRCIASQGKYFEGDHSDIQQYHLIYECATFSKDLLDILCHDFALHSGDETAT